jgi:hypothetical protein
VPAKVLFTFTRELNNFELHAAPRRSPRPAGAFPWPSKNGISYVVQALPESATSTLDILKTWQFI